jgi:transcription elongation GreA/GreB family factor
MITKIGKQKLEQTLKDLKEELRLTYQKRSEAAAEGDLKENSAYIFAGEQANVLNTQINEVMTDLKTSAIQSAPTHIDFICFGHRITLHFLTDNREMTITLVGKNDARLEPSWISCESPLGIAVMGKKKSDQVIVNNQPVNILDIQIGDI